MLLAAGRTTLEMRTESRNRGVRVGAGDLELDVTVEFREALVATELGPVGAEETTERLLDMWLIRQVRSSFVVPGIRPRAAR